MAPISPYDVQLLLASIANLSTTLSNLSPRAHSTDYHRLLLYIDTAADSLHIARSGSHSRLHDITSAEPSLFIDSGGIKHLINIQWRLACLCQAASSRARL